MITTKEFPDLTKNAKVAWYKGFDSVMPVASKLYDVYSVDEQTSEHSDMVGSAFASRKNEGEKYSKGRVVQGYTTLFSQLQIGEERDVTYVMRKFDKYREINKLMHSMGKVCHNRMELDLTHQLSFGFAGTYVNRDGETVSCKTGDGLSLFNTAHTITGSDATFSNKITAAFDRTALESAEELFTDMIDNLGTKVIIKPNVIITGDDPTLVNTVREFLESTVKIGAQNATKNVFEAKYQHVILPWLSTDGNGAKDSAKSDYWMLASTEDTGAICEISDAPKFIAPNVGGNGEDFHTDDWTYKTNAMYDLGMTFPQWIVGSDGTT